jgi:hypothetical protein
MPIEHSSYDLLLVSYFLYSVVASMQMHSGILESFRLYGDTRLIAIETNS